MAVDVEHAGFRGAAHARSRASSARDSEPRSSRLSRRLRFFTSSLTRRILAINLLVLAVPIGGFFFLEQYQQSLINQKIEALRVQGEIFAGAIGASAVVNTPGVGQRLEPARSGELLRRLTAPTSTRARLFSVEGGLVRHTGFGGATWRRAGRDPAAATTRAAVLEPAERHVRLCGELVARPYRIARISGAAATDRNRLPGGRGCAVWAGNGGGSR